MVSLKAKFFYLDNAESTYKTGFKALQWVTSNTAHTWVVYLLLVNTSLYERQDRLKALQCNTAHTWCMSARYPRLTHIGAAL